MNRQDIETTTSPSMPFAKALALVPVLLAFGIGFLTGCTQEKTAEEVPSPHRSDIAKSFFVGDKPKTFLCGWASMSESGSLGESMMGHNANKAIHCNIQFQITERELLGLLINPSFPDKPERWKKILSIPISQHYYYEARKDEYGRDTKDMERNSGRSDWSARPYMSLDLDRVRVFDASVQGMDGGIGVLGAEVLSVSDIEFEEKPGKNFFAFTTELSVGGAEGELQSSMRFNFLEFQHNTEFKPTPYHATNAEFINVLHILGSKDRGVDQHLYVGKWDTKRVHEIYLKNFPPDQVDMGKDIVSLWNDQFEKLGHGRPFKAVINNDKMKYGFDLRYSAIYWVEDERISQYSPLGIGLAAADVRNGEILWAGVNVFAGAINRSVMDSKENKSMPGASTAQDFNLSALPKFHHFESLKMDLEGLYSSLASRYAEKLQSLDQEKIKIQEMKIAAAQTDEARRDEQEKLKVLQQQLSQVRPDPMPRMVLSKLQEVDRLNQFSLTEFLSSKLFSFFNQSAEKIAVVETAKSSSQRPKILSREEYNKVALDKATLQGLSTSSQVFDLDMTVENATRTLSAATLEAIKDKPHAYLMRTYMKEILLHEFGHIIGLGHDFKANIIPKEGDVPSKYIEEMKKKATREAGYTQTTSIMNYRDLRTTIRDEYKDIVPGANDTLMLHYLYNAEYPIYKAGDADFTFVRLESDGQIDPKHADGYKLAYFPSCGDAEASLYTDPYCNRWAVGFDAETLVEEYLNELELSLSRSLFATPELRGRNSDRHEYFTMARSLTAMTRVRNFYDYMRMTYETQIKQIASNENMLYGFSCACSAKDETTLRSNCGAGGTSNISLKPYEIDSFLKIFNENPEFKSLCAANGYAVKRLADFMAKDGADYTNKIYSNQYFATGMPGGDVTVNNSNADGTWDSQSIFPVKISALLNLTTVTPMFVIEGGLYPIDKYSSDSTKYSYATLYPIEFTDGISNAIIKNIHLKSPGYESGQMGRLITHIGYFMYEMQQSKDNQNLSLPPRYWDHLYSQTKFDISLNAIMLYGLRYVDSAKEDLIYGFKGTVIDPDFRTETEVDYAYPFPGSQLLVRSKDQYSMLLPIQNLIPKRFSKQSGAPDGLTFAYSIRYQSDVSDPLRGHSVKKHLIDLYNAQLDLCAKNNGLAEFFSPENPKFSGFLLPQDVDTDERVMADFNRTLIDSYKTLREQKGQNLKDCDEVINSIGLISASVMVINGYYTNEINKYVRF